jgi:hypothetical protein
MRGLALMPLDQRCWCGWDRIGGCYGRCNDTHPGLSRKDYLELACPQCHTLGTHRIKCPQVAP